RVRADLDRGRDGWNTIPTMRRLALALLPLVLIACARPTPKQLAAHTTYSLAREQGRYVKVGRLDIFAITRGQGRDVVLLHGNPASTYTWRKVIEPLAEHYRVHAIDLPGYG